MKKMKLLYIIWGVLVIALVAVLTYIGFQYKNKIKPYKDMENKLIETAKKYVELNFMYPENGEIIVIKGEDLIKDKLIDDIIVSEKACEGYVTVSYNGVYNYKGYIKCETYTTKGYQK